MFNVLQLRKIFGSRVTVAPKRKPRPTFKPRLEALEERWCPAATDTLVWNPVAGSQDASQVTNWYDQNLQRQLTQNDPAPAATNPIVLDGNKANKPIECTAAMSVASITVKNAYNNDLIADANGSVTTSANDTVNNGCILTIVSNVPTGGDAGIMLTNGASFTVAAGGTLNLSDPLGATAGVAFLGSADANKAGEYLNNAGSVTWNGTAVASGNRAINDFLDVPVLNTGTFNADGGTKGQTNVVSGILSIYFKDGNTNNVSFYQTAGSFNLKNGAVVRTDSGYYQSGGFLTTSDSSTCQLCGGILGNGDINIAGGKVVVDTMLNSIGTFKFAASTVEINGEIDVNGLTQQGGKSTSRDLLDCGSATVTLGTHSSLVVGTTGRPDLGTGNQWIVMQYGSIVNSWGTVTVPPTMSASTGATQILVSN